MKKKRTMLFRKETTMDIYNFINSKDIEKHCRAIGYRFNPLESAYLIWQSAKHSIEEKHMAYQELMETTENQNITKPHSHDDRQYYLHNFLKQYMEVENKLLCLFNEDGDHAAYSYDVYWGNNKWGNGIIRSDSELFATFHDCISAWRDDWDEEDHVAKTYVYKRWLRSRENPKNQQIRIQLLTGSENVNQLSCCGNVLTGEEKDIFMLFESYWLYVPTPFQKGDIVYAPLSNGIGMFSSSGYDPCVLDFICYHNEDEEWIQRMKQHADNSDMTAWCYFLNDDGKIYHECMHDYLSLEYYPKELTGKERVFQPISSYLKDKIDMVLLLNASSVISAEGFIDDCQSCLWYTEEGLKLAGLSKDKR